MQYNSSYRYSSASVCGTKIITVVLYSTILYPFGVNLYQKSAILAIFGVKAHIFKATILKFRVMVRT